MRILMWHCVTEMIIFFLALLGKITLFLSTGKYYKEKLRIFFFFHTNVSIHGPMFSLSLFVSPSSLSLSPPPTPLAPASVPEKTQTCVSLFNRVD